MKLEAMTRAMLARGAGLMSVLLALGCTGGGEDSASGVVTTPAGVAAPARVAAGSLPAARQALSSRVTTRRERRPDQVVARLSASALAEVEGRGYVARRLDGGAHSNGVYALAFDSRARTPEQVIAELSQLPDAQVEPDFRRYAFALPSDPDIDAVSRAPAHLFQISAPSAWDTTSGTGTVIAVIDSGVDLAHPDLATTADGTQGVWVNRGEVPNDGLDNDQNGYVDDVRGYDFVTATPGEVAPGEDPGPPDNDPSDFNGHGTHVAGIAAAVGDNGVGTAGVAHHAKIMALRAGYSLPDGRGVLNDSDIIAAIYYAARNGANVINMSFGGPDLSQAEQQALDFAAARGVVLVAAAGNDGNSEPQYPGAYDEVLAVAALDGSSGTEAQQLAYFSTYGRWVDVAAPGMNVYSTTLGGQWGPDSGTSMASPVVAGVAALVKAAHPGWSREQIAAQVISAADSVDAFNPRVAGLFGAGRVNASKAVGAELELPHQVRLISTSVYDLGDGDGELESGESFEVQVALEAPFVASSVTAALSSTHASLTVSPAQLVFGVVPAGQVVTGKFTVRISESAPIALEAYLDVSLTGGREPISRKVQVFLNPLLRSGHVIGNTRHYTQLPLALPSGAALLVTDQDDGVYGTLRKSDGSFTAHTRLSAPLDSSGQCRDCGDYVTEPDASLGPDGKVYVSYYVVHQVSTNPSWVSSGGFESPPQHHRQARVVVVQLDPSTFGFTPEQQIATAYLGLSFPGRGSEVVSPRSTVVSDAAGQKYVAYVNVNANGASAELREAHTVAGVVQPSALLRTLPETTNDARLALVALPDGSRRLFYEASDGNAVLESGLYQSSGAAFARVGALPIYGDHLEPFVQGGQVRMFYQETAAPFRLMLAKLAGGTWVTDQVVSANFTANYPISTAYADVAMSPEGIVYVADQQTDPTPVFFASSYFRYGPPGNLVTYRAMALSVLNPWNPRIAIGAGGVAHLFYMWDTVAGTSGGSQYFTSQVGTFQPRRPTVTDEGAVTDSATILRASFASNGTVAASSYRYAIGTSPVASDAQGFVTTAATSAIAVPVGGFKTRQSYYFTAYALAADGRASAPGVSDGICIRDCTGRACGSDGCGGICGAATCPGGGACSAEGQCETSGGSCAAQKLAPVAAAASSVENAHTPASAAIDGSLGTRWSSAFADPQWLRLDLGARRAVTRVELRWEAAASKSYELQVSDDGVTWRKIYADVAGNGGVDDVTGLEASGRYLRVYSTSRTTGFGVSLWEINVFGDTEPDCGCAAPAPTPLSVVAARASSQETAATPASAAADGIATTRWSSQFADPQWLELDFGAARRIDTVELRWETAASRSYQLQVSDDRTQWRALMSTTSGDGGTDLLTGLFGRGRYLRVFSTQRTTGFGVSLWEVKVQGSDAGSCAGAASSAGTLPPP
ncbi:MAG: hypothetical protein EOO73_03005 [Myxococcales bacterium]|nr:MAG: hypothetical protein EOO73_03005 [Myxococcales bacterium]